MESWQLFPCNLETMHHHLKHGILPTKSNRCHIPLAIALDVYFVSQNCAYQLESSFSVSLHPSLDVCVVPQLEMFQHLIP